MEQTRSRVDVADGCVVSRRGLLAAVGAGLAGAAVPAAARQGSAAWPLFQYDLRNTGHAQSRRGPRQAAGARWGYLDGGSFGSAPVVTSDAVYAADPGAGAVVALDRTSGTVRWTEDADVGDARMTYVDGSLLVPADVLEVRSPADGSREWSVSTGNPTSVAVRGSYAFVTASDGVYRVRLNAQEIGWHNSRLSRPQPGLVVTDDYVYAVGTQYGSVLAMDPATGNRRWLRRIGTSATGAPTLADRTVVVPGEDAVVALSNESGLEQWRYDAPAAESVAVVDGVVYGSADGDDVFAVDLETGEERWRTPAVPGSNPPVVADGLLYLAGTDGSVVALSPSDGTVVWEATVGGEHVGSVAVADGELLLGDREGRFAALAAGASGGLDEGTPTSTQTDPPAGDDGDGDGAGSTDAPTETGAPGFGLVTGALATGAGALAAARRRRDD